MLEARRHLRAIHRHLVTWIDRHAKEMVAVPLDIGSQGHQSRDKVHTPGCLGIGGIGKFVTQESAQADVTQSSPRASVQQTQIFHKETCGERDSHIAAQTMCPLWDHWDSCWHKQYS